MIREGLMDYFTGRGSCQGLIPSSKGLWLDSDDFNRIHEFMKPGIKVFLHSKNLRFRQKMV